MEVKQGYKLTEVGVIPEDWQLSSLASISSFITKGSTPTTYGFKWETSGILFLRSECVSDEGLDLTESMFITQKAHHALKRSEVEDGDILITITGNVGRVVFLENTGVANLNQHIARVRIASSFVVPKFIYHCLNQATMRKRFLSITTGQAYPQISLQQVRDTSIPLPPLPEQTAIATALSDVDSLISSLDALITKKKQIKQGAMQELLSGKRRLPGFSGEWEVKRLGEVTEIVMGQSPSSKNYNNSGYGFPLIQGNADIFERQAIKQTFTTEITKLGRNGDILMSVRAPVGEISMTSFDACLGRGVCALRHANNFLYHYLISLEPTWVRLSKGSTFDSVNSSDVRRLFIRIPPTEAEQQAIAAILSDMDAEITALESRRDKTKLLKQGLMQELLTGRIRLPIEHSTVSDRTKPTVGMLQ